MAEEKIGIDFFAKLAGFNKLTNAANKVDRLKKIAEKASGAFARFNQAALKIGRVGEGMQAWGATMMMRMGIVYTAAQDLSRKFNTVVGAFTAVETKGKELGMVLAPMGNDIKKSIDYATKAALNFSKKYGIAATDIMEAQYLLASAKITDPLITTKAAEWTIKLAKATREDIASAAKIWANAANTFFDGATLTEDQMQKLSDTLAKTQQKFQFENLYQLGEGLNYAGSVARSLQIPLETTTTLLGTLNTAGIQGSMAGTGLQQTFLRLTKAAGKLNINMTRTEDGTLDVINVFKQLKGKMVGMNSEARTLFLQKLFGDRAFKAVATILDKLDQVEKDLIDVSSATGVATKSFENMQKTTATAFAKIRENAFALFYTIGAKIAPSLIKLSNFAVKVIQKITEFADRHPYITKMAGAFLGVGAAIAGIMLPLMTFIGIFTWGLGTIVRLFGKIPAVINLTRTLLIKLNALRIGTNITTGFTTSSGAAVRLSNGLRGLNLTLGRTSSGFTTTSGQAIVLSRSIKGSLMPALHGLYTILGYVTVAAGSAFIGWKIGRFLGQLKMGTKSLDEWVQKFYEIHFFGEKIEGVLGRIIDAVGWIVMPLGKIFAKRGSLEPTETGTIEKALEKQNKIRQLWIKEGGEATEKFKKEWSEIGYGGAAPTTAIELQKRLRQRLEIVQRSPIPYGPREKVPAGITQGKTEAQKLLDYVKGGAADFSPGGIGIPSPKDITAAARPEINNNYYTTHFERDSVQINTAELSPEKFITLLEEVIRRKALVNEPA